MCPLAILKIKYIKSCKFCGHSQQLPVSVSPYVNVNVKAFCLSNSRFRTFRQYISPLYWRTCLSGSNKGFIILTVSSKPADHGRLQAPPYLSNCSSGPWRCEKVKVGKFMSIWICIQDTKKQTQSTWYDNCYFSWDKTADWHLLKEISMIQSKYHSNLKESNMKIFRYPDIARNWGYLF